MPRARHWSGAGGHTSCHPERNLLSSRARDDSYPSHSYSPFPSAFFRSHHAIRSATRFSYPNPPGV
jgi:hypothetical protein